MEKEIILRCDMRRECKAPVSYIDSSGFVYCAFHGEQRKRIKRCRRLKAAELRKLSAGETLSRYEVSENV
jgi:hypothetical protein